MGVPQEKQKRPAIVPVLRYIGGGVLLVGSTVGLLLLPINYSALGNYGYAGVFVVTLVASGGILVPVPYLPAIVVAGTYLNPLTVGIVAGFAAAAGEMTGYLVGCSGRTRVQKMPMYHQVEGWVGRYGLFSIFALSVVPNPIFDAAGMAAGALRVPAFSFWLACFLGKTIRCIGFAYLGVFLPSWLD